MATREELQLKVKLLEELAKKDTSSEVGDTLPKAQSLLQSFQNAMNANQTSEADRIAKEIVDLANSAFQFVTERRQAAAQQKSDKYWTYGGILVLFVVFGGLAWFVYHYITGVGLGKLSSIEGTRPLLVIAAIISTIAFGGSLLLGSLFSSQGTFQERFRYAREIFLVFSGVFGTIMGFYFGAGESKALQLGIAAMLENETVVAYATGGTPPYKITVIYGTKGHTKTEETKTGWARFPFDKKKDNIIPLTVSASDSKTLQGSFVLDLKKEELTKDGWVLPEESSPIQPPKSAGGKALQPGGTDVQPKPSTPPDKKNQPGANK